MSTHLLSALACTIVAGLPAQMSGTYTLDPNGTGPRNFKTFLDANYSLVTQGISGPVVFEVAAGTWVGKQEIYGPAGMSATRTITLRSSAAGQAILQRSATADRVLQSIRTNLAAFEGFIVEGLVFRGTSTNDRANVLLAGDNIVVRDCRFEFCSFKVTGDRNEVHHCDMSGGLRTSLDVSGAGCSVHHSFVSTNLNGSVGMSFGGPGLGQTRTRVYDNIFVSTGTGVTCVNVGGGIDLVHNTIISFPDRTWTQNSVKVGTQFVASPSIRNNIIVNLNQGRVINVGGTITPYHIELDDNLYWAPNSVNLFIAENTSYATLAAWQQASGLSKGATVADPAFVDTNTLPAGLKLKNTSPAIGAAVNTPSYVTDDFEGQPRATPATQGAYKGPRRSTFVTFGKGCAGSGQFVPAIGFGGTLAMGSQDFRVTLSNARGGLTVQAFLVIGVTKATISLGGGCDLLLQPVLLLQTNVRGTGPGNGTAEFGIPLPSNPVLQGAVAHLQWGVVDPAAAGIGMAMSDGGTLTL